MATNTLPADIEHRPRARILDVEYVHVALADGDDLYLTIHGLPFAEQLLPENYWTDKSWFRANSQSLPGTSTVYRIRTKPAARRSRDIVLKWNRMGQDVPGETMVHELSGAEFNSPFEEFSLTRELRLTRQESPGWVLTHKPLAIYVPRGRLDLERLGRKQYKLEAKQDNHQGVFLDMHRRYAVIYEWIKGIDAAEAWREGLLTRPDLEALLARAEDEMRWKGFVVHDNKPQHLIVRRRGQGGLLRDRQGRIVFANVDFELLQRTPKREQAVRAAKRRTYLTKQAHRFEVEASYPPHLKPVRIFGVEYVFGQVESTGGALWVVGKDPVLFDYFLPEQWRRTPRTKLSVVHQTYHTTTKDNIQLVWKVSRVGETPDLDPFRADEKRILDHGYNSPFEEVAMSLELSARGIAAVYPRAIYMTGSKSDITRELSDDRRYSSHAGLITPEGHPILRKGRNYILLWGFWNGPDELLAQRDEDRCQGVSALHACREGIVDEQTYLQVMHVARSRLAEAGIEDLNLRGNHLLLSLTPEGELMTDPDRLPTIRICNFELLRRTRGGA